MNNPIKPRKLTRRQKNWADLAIKEPKLTGIELAMKTYNPKNKTSAAQISSNNFRNPNIQAYMTKHSDIATEAMMETLAVSRAYAKKGNTSGAAYAGVVATISKDIHDRVYGKATQRLEVQSTKVSVNIDLTSGESDVDLTGQDTE